PPRQFLFHPLSTSNYTCWLRGDGKNHPFLLTEIHPFYYTAYTYTLNMKKVESAVTNIVNGRPVTNRDALANPECLDYYERILP
ncbi:hypothetical protein, partial [Desulfofundulus thermobenzoicus]|uniref:hypothetical protein n=1 Tax=Desulfofundulus thermobenzoicus TaxID=29376 RepID=UPI001A9AD74D